LLLLNVPPDKRGLFHENDVKSLKGFRAILDREFAKDLAAGAKITASSHRGKSDKYSPAMMNDGNKNTYWTTDDNIIASSFQIDLRKKEKIKYLVLEEFIRLGQRVSKFDVEVWENSKWRKVADATTIGHKRILKLDSVETTKIKVNIVSSRACPLISAVSVY
jgi:alpha-L-fucosidase